jgi:hypothetical protein
VFKSDSKVTADTPLQVSNQALNDFTMKLAAFLTPKKTPGITIQTSGSTHKNFSTEDHSQTQNSASQDKLKQILQSLPLLKKISN